MWHNIWRRWLDHKPSVRRGAARRRPASCRPWLEALEDRTLPTSFSPNIFSDSALPGSGTLRAAVIAANADGQDDTITLAAATYQLTIRNNLTGHESAAATGDLNLTSAGHTLIIQGQGAALTTIDGGLTDFPTTALIDRLFQVLPGVNVIFRDLTLTGGIALDDGTDGRPPGQGSSFGGAILNAGTVTLQDVIVEGNIAQGGRGADGMGLQDGGLGYGGVGGGIANSGRVGNLAKLIILRSTLRRNFALGGNGGSALGPGNGGDGGVAIGGGVSNFRGEVAVTASTLDDNLAQGGLGGEADLFAMPLQRGGMGGDGNGGGLASVLAEVTFSNSTVSKNSAVGGDGGVGGFYGGAGGNGLGGGVAGNEGQLNFRNSTVAGNAAAGGGGGFTRSPSGTLGLAGTGQGGGVSAPAAPTSSYTSTSSLFARNTADSNRDFFGLFNQVDHTLVMDGQGAAGITGGVNGNIVNVDAMLDTLGFNGGPTQTMALLPDSPALDRGANPDGLTTDQRGQPRVSNFLPDIGAFELFVLPRLLGGIAFTTTQGEQANYALATFENGNPASDPTQLIASINWGDGSKTTSGSIRLRSGVTYEVDGSHTYQQPGAYRITITLSDTTGHSSTAQDNIGVAAIPPPPPPPAPPPPPPAPPLPQFAARVVHKKKGKFLVQITDATGAKRLSLTFGAPVQVFRQDVNGDGVLDVVLQFRQGHKLHRLAFSGRDLAPLPA